MNPIFCAIDTTDFDKAKRLIAKIAPHVGGIKLGLEFFTSHGAEGVRRVMPEGFPLFLDLKFHDIPNTVAGAVRAMRGLNVSMFTVHASGGAAMMKAAAEAASQLPSKPKMLGVTVLTSMEQADVASVGIQDHLAERVMRLATLAKASGAGGVVCSPHEIPLLRGGLGKELALVVPGIRPTGAEKGDQKRVMTPKQAMDADASYLVIGRPITEAEDPAKAAAAIAATLS